MNDASIESALADCERELAAGRVPDLRARGFWRAVASLKRHRDLIPRYADRCARIDRVVFERRVRLRTDAAVGSVTLALGLAVGVLILGAAAPLDHPWRELAVLVAAGAFEGTTHGLAHFVVGNALGIRFTHWFIDPPLAPGFKVDYASYLRASATRRAWMHAAGAIVTKLTPFVVIPYALAIRCDTWAVAILVALGVIQLITDVLFSVKASDWKKFRREMALAR